MTEEGKNFHPSPRSECCQAGVVAQIKGSWIGREHAMFIPILWDDPDFVNRRCGRCNRAI